MKPRKNGGSGRRTAFHRRFSTTSHAPFTPFNNDGLAVEEVALNSFRHHLNYFSRRVFGHFPPVAWINWHLHEMGGRNGDEDGQERDEREEGRKG